MRLKSILALIVLLLAPLAADAAEPVIEIVNPEDQSEVEGAIVPIFVKVKNLPPAVYVIELQCGAATHFLMIDPRDPWTSDIGNYWITSGIMTANKGANTFTVEVKSEDGTKVIATSSVSFTTKEPSDETKREALNGVRGVLASAAYSMKSDERSYRNYYFEEKAGLAERKMDLVFRAKYYASYINHDFMQRSYAYALLASHYEDWWKPGDALRALEHAKNIFEEEKDIKINLPDLKDWSISKSPVGISSPPGHYDGYAEYYIRRMAIGRSTEWLEKKADWYVEQAEFAKGRNESDVSARREAAAAYRKIAHYHFLLEKDYSAYDTWIERYLRILPKERAGLNSADYFGLIKGVRPLF